MPPVGEKRRHDMDLLIRRVDGGHDHRGATAGVAPHQPAKRIP